MDTKTILNNIEIEALLSSLLDTKINNIFITGLYSSAKSFAISSVVENGLHFIILNNKEDASVCINDLYNIKDEEKIFFFPSSENKNLRSSIKDASLKVQRTAAISAIKEFSDKNNNKDYLIIVGYKESIEELVVNKKDLNESIIDLKVGDKYSHSFIKEALVSYGFDKKDFVSQPGEFAVRGGLIDIFPYNNNIPYRIEFFGEEIESLRSFNSNTQRSIDNYDKISIYSNITDNISENSESVFNLLPKNSTIWYGDESLISDEYKGKYIVLSSLTSNNEYDRIIEFHTTPQPTFNKQFDLIASDIKTRESEGYEVYIMSENKKQIERLQNILQKYNLKVKFESFTIQEGFIDNDSKICLYTDHQIFDRFRRLKINRSVERSERLTMEDINSFRDGDYIVHIDHGVGRFGGLVKNNINGKIQEAIKLVYRDGDVIFVSIHGLHRISKIGRASCRERV